MRKTINPYWKARLFWAFLIVVTVIAFMCSGCSTIERSKQRVLLDPKARHEVFLDELTRFPCDSDSSLNYLRGSIDSASLNGYRDFLNKITLKDFYAHDKSDTLSFKKQNSTKLIGEYIDSGHTFYLRTQNIYPTVTLHASRKVTVSRSEKEVTNYYPEEEIINAYKTGWSTGVKAVRPDTAKYTIKDRQKEKLDRDSIVNLLREKSAYIAVISQLEKNNKLIDQKVTGWIWLFVIACVLGAAGIVGVAVYKFKKTMLPI